MAVKNSILIVDDQESVIKSLKRLLLQEKYDILSASGGNEALDIIRDNKDDIFLIISDQRMPGMTGTVFMENSVGAVPDAIRFILSGYSDRDSASRAIQSGIIHRYLEKPWDSDELLLMIKKAYESPQLFKTPLSDDASGNNPTFKPSVIEKEIKEFDEKRKNRALGRIAVQHGFITQTQLDSAMTAMHLERQAGRHVSLENILYERGVISSEIMGKLMAVTRRRLGKAFGMIAIRDFGVSQEDIEKASSIQSDEFKKTSTCRLIGDILVAERILSEEQKESIVIDMLFSENEMLSPDERSEAPEIAPAAESAADSEEQKKSILNQKKKLFFRQRAFDKILCKRVINRNHATEQEILKYLETQLIHFTKTFESRPVMEILVENSIISKELAADIEASVAKRSRSEEARTSDSTEMEQKSSEVVAATGGDGNVNNNIISSDSSKNIFNIGEDNQLRLAISPDGMEAHIESSGGTEISISKETLKEELSKHGIIYGIIDDLSIELLLHKAASKGSKFLIAQGKKEISGIDSRIRYFFEDENSRFGKELNSGKFDYRDRGEIASISKGTLLAEKIPPLPAYNGINIFGDELVATQPSDSAIHCGKGVALSQDGLKAVAMMDGRPDISQGGIISVMPSKVIKGNVDFKVGNIKFNGDVSVNGTILSGFSVTSNNLTANDIEEAEVNASGSVLVKNCVNSSSIKSGGSIAAKILKKSTISAGGDIVVQKEIIDCTIITSGKVTVLRGRIVSSTIHAADGVEAMNIGSDVSSPCHIFPGSEDHSHEIEKAFEEKLKKNRDQIARLQIFMDQHDQLIREQLNNLADLSKQQEQFGRDRKSIQSEMEMTSDKAAKDQMNREIQEIDKKAQELEQVVNKLFDEHETTQTKADEIREKIEALENILSIHTIEYDGFRKWYGKKKCEAIKNGIGVSAAGIIYAGTRITGGNSSITIKSDIRNSKVHQVAALDNQNREFYEMRVDTLSSKSTQPHVFRV